MTHLVPFMIDRVAMSTTPTMATIEINVSGGSAPRKLNSSGAIVCFSFIFVPLKWVK